ncbi:unnamed protein product, partial [marine sediment metagenome]
AYITFQLNNSQEIIVSVISPTVTITVHAIPVPTLSLAVDKTDGWLGDVFTFYGVLMQNGAPVAGTTISLFRNAAVVGTGVTDGAGNYSIPWIADVEGFLSFHTEAPQPPLPPLMSPTLGLGVGLELPELTWLLGPMVVGTVLTAYSLSMR